MVVCNAAEPEKSSSTSKSVTIKALVKKCMDMMDVKDQWLQLSFVAEDIHNCHSQQFICNKYVDALQEDDSFEDGSCQIKVRFLIDSLLSDYRGPNADAARKYLEELIAATGAKEDEESSTATVEDDEQ